MPSVSRITRLAMTAGGIVALDARAVRSSVAAVSAAGPGDMDRPTPCGDWSLGQLLAHMTAQHDGFAAAARGVRTDLSAWQPRSPTADPVTDYAAAADRILAAFATEDVLTRSFFLPELNPTAEVPGTFALTAHFVDNVAHGWDVARTLGKDYEPEPDLIGVALAIAESIPDDQTRLQPGAPFAPSVDVPGDAAPLDRFVALLGRPPRWQPAR